MRSFWPFKYDLLGSPQKRGKCPSHFGSELTGIQKRAAKGVDQTFPEALKEPVLRRIQFSTVSRLDHLVEQIYDARVSDIEFLTT